MEDNEMEDYGVDDLEERPIDDEIEYFAVVLDDHEIEEVRNTVIAYFEGDDLEEEEALLMTRFLPRYHNILIHRNEKDSDPELWDYYVRRFHEALDADEDAGLVDGELDPAIDGCTVNMSKLIWDSKIMAFEVTYWTEYEAGEEQYDAPRYHEGGYPNVVVALADPCSNLGAGFDLLERYNNDDFSRGDIWVRDKGPPILFDGHVRAVLRGR